MKYLTFSKKFITIIFFTLIIIMFLWFMAQFFSYNEKINKKNVLHDKNKCSKIIYPKKQLSGHLVFHNVTYGSCIEYNIKGRLNRNIINYGPKECPKRIESDPSTHICDIEFYYE